MRKGQRIVFARLRGVTDTAMLAAVNLKVHYRAPRGQTPVKAVDGVDFDVHCGETVGIIGESGSGKSTLARALVCLNTPSSGQVIHLGKDPFTLKGQERRDDRRSFQIIFQDPNSALDPRMTILRSVREPLDIAGDLRVPERNAMALTLLDRVGMDGEFATRFPHQLSGGQKQRVNIARALASRPRLIICDEVVAALDVSIQADILNLFAQLQRDLNLTYLFISHDLGVVGHVSDRIIVMYLGRFMEMGPAHIVLGRPLHPYTQALLSSEPEPLPTFMHSPRRIVLKGEIPSPASPPSGCRFRTRCPIATDECASAEPQWRQVEDGRWIACHFPDGTDLDAPDPDGRPCG